MNLTKRTFTITEIMEMTGLDQELILSYIEREWILPEVENYMDDQDLARIQLIEDLQKDFGVNEEAIPVILHLVDQLCFIRSRSR